MKKLIMALVAVAAVTTVNAAAVQWNSGTISLPSGAAAKNTVEGALFIVSESVYNTYAAYTDATKLSDDIYAAYKDAIPTATKTSTTKSVANIKYDGGYSAGDSVYAILLYTTTEDATDYWMGNYGTVTLASAQDVSVADLALKMGGTGSATAWSTAAVPEPTSGLLMLLGMAGLALRRRRA